jgi:hypothetical protein
MNKSLKFKNSSHPQQGIALVTVLILLVMITGLITVSTLLALGNRGSSTDTIYATKAQNLAEAGIEKALDTVFYETYRRWVISGEGSSNVKFDVCAFKKWLTGNWGASSYSTQKKTSDIENNNASCTYNNGVASKPNNSSAGVDAAVLPALLNNTEVSLPSFSVDDPNQSVNVTVKRVDSGDSINLTIVSNSVINNGTKELAGKKLTRTLQLAGSPFPGDEYAMLTNDINCSFCHLQVDNMTRAYADPLAAENVGKTFKRIKLGALSAINFDFTSSATNDTLIAGTVYSRGTSAPTAGLNVHFAPWASATEPGLIKPAASKSIAAAISTTKYTAAVAGATYDPAVNFQESLAINATAAGAKKMGKLYYNYPQGSGIDGILPEKFPSIIKDTDGDKLISDAEWDNHIVGGDSGSLVPSNGAVIYGVKRPKAVSNVGPGVRDSYDPINANPTFNGTRVGDNLVAGFWNNGVTAKALGAPMTPAMLASDINVLNVVTRAFFATGGAKGIPAPYGTGATATLTIVQNVEIAFANQWRGWLVQQAIASPNNRDLRPTNGTADLAADAFPLAAPYSPLAGFNPIVVPTGTALTVNNFWVAYDPTTSNIHLAYCRADPCIIANGQANATPEGAGVRNISIVPGAAALSNNIAVLSIPFAASNIFPTASNTAVNDLATGTYSSKSGYFDGNLIVDAGRIGETGAAQRYVTISGTVHVNGDLVIRGQIKDEGRFIVRGNIYIVGDLVYGCISSACKIKDGTNASYTNPANLPKVAYMAGGSIIVGDYDHPDGRANRSQFNLINDQIGQDRGIGNLNAPVNTPNAANWVYQSVPGSTGNNAVGAAGTGNRVMGFVHELAAIGNNHTNVRFSSSPFGFLSYRGGLGLNILGNYELPTSGGVAGPINATGTNPLGTYSLQTLYPSNGPMRIGDRTLAGFNVQPAAGAAIGNLNLGCINNAAQLPNLPTVFDATTRPLNSGFWCPPLASGKALRTWNGAGASPAADVNAWMPQPTQNQVLDGIGMTTGWLGGLLQTNQAGIGYDQLGDISQTRILKIMWLATMETAADRDPNTTGTQTQGPLRTDGMLYSPNSLFCVARYRRDNSLATGSNTQARWIHHGSLLSFELGFLLTGDANTLSDPFTVNRTAIMNHQPATTSTSGTSSGANNYGPSMGVFYDERLAGLLGFAGGALEIRRTGVYTQTGR